MVAIHDHHHGLVDKSNEPKDALYRFMDPFIR